MKIFLFECVIVVIVVVIQSLTELQFYRSSAGKNLPVYLERKRKTITAVRRFRGDKEVKYKCNIVTVSDDGEKAIAEELAKVCPGAEVYHCAGSVAVVGDHRAAIQAWLLGLGF